MVSRAKSVCRRAGCGVLIEVAGYCVKHTQLKHSEDNAKRGTAHERGYTSAWMKARRYYLQAHPLCVYCQCEGIIRAATVVDHITPHRLKEAIDSGDQPAIRTAQALFWDSQNNWQSLCSPHHNSTKQSEESVARRAQGRVKSSTSF